MSRALLALVLASLIGGCGFELRGTRALPEGLESIYVRGPGAIGDALAIEVESAGATVHPSRDGASAVISVTDERFARRVLSVDAETGKEREIELAYVVHYTLSRGTGAPLAGAERVNLLRDYALDADAVIGKSREESVLRGEMRRDAAQQILRRLETTLR